MADASYAIEIDLRLGERAGGREKFGIRTVSSNLASEVLDLLRAFGIEVNRNAQAMAECTSRGAYLTLFRPRTGARPGVGTVRLICRVVVILQPALNCCLQFPVGRPQRQADDLRVRRR